MIRIEMTIIIRIVEVFKLKPYNESEKLISIVFTFKIIYIVGIMD